MEIAVIENTAVSLVKPARIEDYLNRFLASQDVKDSSRQLYGRTMKQFFTWVSRKGYLLSEISRAEIIEYKMDLLAQGMSSLTVSSYITSVRRFYEWAEGNKYST